MGFDDAADDDMKLVLEGVSILIAPAYQELLDDTVLDFVELEPGEFNFIFMDARHAERAQTAPERRPADAAAQLRHGWLCRQGDAAVTPIATTAPPQAGRVYLSGPALATPNC